MRLKTFTAPTLADAMELVRRDMGEDAIIVSTQQGSDALTCRVTAAIEDTLEAEESIPTEPEAMLSDDALEDYLRQVLTAHGLPAHMINATVRAALKVGEPDPALALAAAIDAGVTFRPIDFDAQTKPLVLAGVPGAGKTITAAKLAARAKLDGRKVFLATTDTTRAGGVEQLDAFARILDIKLCAVDTSEALAAHKDAVDAADVAIIDTAGVNPFRSKNMNALQGIAAAVGGELVLVLPAGGDAMESADTAAAFADIGAERMIITRLDMTRRLGGILAAGLGRVAIANVSINPRVAEGLDKINPVALARLIVPEDETEHFSLQTKVAP